jgi:Spy/CpxP family protein refolding chaperone
MLSAAASAQQRRPGGFGFGDQGSWITLLGVTKVQEELELSDEQKTDLRKVGEEAREQLRGLFTGAGNFRDLSEEERNKRMAEIREKSAAANKEIQKKVEGVLLEHQVARLKEISLQVRGLAALQDAEVQTALGISADQKEQLTKVSEENREKFRSLFQGGQGGNREEARERFEQARKEANDRTLAVLTAEQKDKFEKMQGEKIEIDLRQGFQGRPGGNAPGRRPNNDNNN